ncbi:MAG: C2H2-type zinc finger protein, partial [Thermofilaceae archaeon]
MASLLKCPECGALFYSREDFEAHFDAWHKPTGPYYLMCPKCGKKLESKAALEEHLRKHPEEEES